MRASSAPPLSHLNERADGPATNRGRTCGEDAGAAADAGAKQARNVSETVQ